MQQDTLTTEPVYGTGPMASPTAAQDALLVLPAYLALALATGAGCYGLAHYVDDSSFTITIYAALAISLLVSYGAHCGNPIVTQASSGTKWLLVGLLLPILIVTQHEALMPQAQGADNQQIVAILVGWTMIALILLAGSRYGGDTVPLAVPLVSTLSLFGVLNNASVDNVITLAFLVYIAAALYLVVYEYMLKRNAQEEAAHRLLAQAPSLVGGASLSSFEMESARADIGGIALQYLLACSAWFACFIVGGVLVYYPFKAILPGVFSSHYGPGAGGRKAIQRVLDWRGSSPILELHGGTYALSDQEVLRVNVRSGESTGLWRGRIYEYYRNSSWVAAQDEVSASKIPLKEDDFTDLGRKLPSIDPAVGERHSITADIQLVNPISRALFASGDITAVRGAWDEVLLNPTGTVTSPIIDRNLHPYSVISTATQARQAALATAPGLSPVDLTIWRNAPSTLKTLQIRDEPDGTRTRIMALAQQIQQAAATTGRPLQTPYQKVLAINDYLHRTCTYSLVTPVVPSNRDAVLFFLTETHEGACDMFASSMALLLRAMDVPARVATGYLEPSREEQTITADGTSFSLRERDAHAWVEYYVPAAGWLDYDPTEGTRVSQITLQMRLSELFHWRDLLSHWQTLVLPGLGLLLLLIGGVWSVLDLRRERGRTTAGMVDVERARVIGAYADAVRQLSRQVPHAPHYTPQEYEAVVDRTALPPAAKQDFAALTYLFITATYSPLTLQVDESQLQS
ncbi:MAG: transglutaminase domain-containing protein, partial [Abitibacteriaceae bacterium]|nr:transglutaminase domain-containing protein [Abditibacteriaceae bacterium]